MRGREHQVGMGRWLLEDFEHVVGGILGEPVGPGDHRYPVPACVRGE